MGELLLEILSEEIPARMQVGAARDLDRLMREGLSGLALGFEALEVFAGPRRLSARVQGVPPRQADRVEVRKGPRIDAPETALAGFLRSTGLARDDLEVRGGVLFGEIRTPGRESPEVLAEMIEALVRGFPWPKSMRWGSCRLRWVRPIRRLLALYQGEVLPLEIDGIRAGALTEGHRFMGPEGPATVVDFAAYERALKERFVLLRREDRRSRILEGARRVCAEAGFELVADEALLEEVTGLVEWPQPLLGEMDPAFLDLPPEVVRTSMRVHQKFFAVRDPTTSGLAPRFVAVANIAASDGGRRIAAGNAKVLAARLRDAVFFWTEDQKVSLEARLSRLEGVTFHAKIGSMADRSRRIERLAAALAPRLGLDPSLAGLAGRLCKADLVTGMVGEFPELQGIMGGYYAALEGRRALEQHGRWRMATTAEEVASVAGAIRDQYRPQGPADALPAEPLGRLLALAEKLDTLVSFFAIGETPTGSRDPFALRRAALGVIRILLIAEAPLRLGEVLNAAAEADPEAAARRAVVPEVSAFIAERLKILLRDQGRRHDLVDAVFALGEDDLASLVERVDALAAFLEGSAGTALLAGYRRAQNILRAEARKEGLDLADYRGEVEVEGPPAERRLAESVRRVTADLDRRLSSKDYAGALLAFSALREPVDAFFEDVLVNDKDPKVRARRLSLLSAVRLSAERVADLSQVSG